MSLSPLVTRSTISPSLRSASAFARTLTNWQATVPSYVTKLKVIKCKAS